MPRYITSSVLRFLTRPDLRYKNDRPLRRPLTHIFAMGTIRTVSLPTGQGPQTSVGFCVNPEQGLESRGGKQRLASHRWISSDTCAQDLVALDSITGCAASLVTERRGCHRIAARSYSTLALLKADLTEDTLGRVPSLENQL